MYLKSPPAEDPKMSNTRRERSPCYLESGAPYPCEPSTAIRLPLYTRPLMSTSLVPAEPPADISASFPVARPLPRLIRTTIIHRSSPKKPFFVRFDAWFGWRSACQTPIAVDNTPAATAIERRNQTTTPTARWVQPQPPPSPPRGWYVKYTHAGLFLPIPPRPTCVYHRSPSDRPSDRRFIT